MTSLTEKMQEKIAEVRSKIQGRGRLVFVSGDFNVIHPGHLRLFNFAAECGDVLVVGVNGDGFGKTILPADMRLESVMAISVVDHALILPLPAADFITLLKPDVVVKGREYSARFNLEQAAVDSYGGKLLFCSGDVAFSSFDLLRKEARETILATIEKPMDYPARHGFTLADLIKTIQSFAGLKVVVLGDLIVDEYIDCEALGMSREDPTLVVSPILSDKFVGGAGIVAAHAAGLGADVVYCGLTGDDPVHDHATEVLRSYRVDCRLVKDDTRPTTLKQRFRAGGKTLLRVSHLRQHDVSAPLMDQMFDRIVDALGTADLVIFSDFNYGCLPQPFVDRVSAFCREAGIPMVADSQASSQISDVSRFRGMMLLTPTEHEARLATRDTQSGLVVLADTLRDSAQASHVIITLAGEGVLIHSPGNASEGLITDRLPAFNRAPRDVSGAGDSLLTCTSMALARGVDIWAAAYLGSTAASCQVGRMGNLPLTADELIAELSQ